MDTTVGKTTSNVRERPKTNDIGIHWELGFILLAFFFCTLVFSPLKKSKCTEKNNKHHPTIGEIIADPGIIWNSSDLLRSPFGHQF